MVVSSCWSKEVRKKYWIQQINLRFQSIEQLWPSSIYALDTRWWSGNGHLLQNENYHKKLRKKIMLCFNSKCWVLSIRRCCFGQFTLYNTYTSSFCSTKMYKKLQKYERKQKIHNATIFHKNLRIQNLKTEWNYFCISKHSVFLGLWMFFQRQ